MEGDNAYLCEELGKRVPAVKRTAIRSLPPLLCVHLKRFEFDYHNQTRHKLRDRWGGVWRHLGLGLGTAGLWRHLGLGLGTAPGGGVRCVSPGAVAALWRVAAC
jgi:hypothetical protein